MIGPGFRGSRALRAAVVLLGLAVIVYAPLLTPGAVPYSPHSDVLPSHLGTQTVLHDALRERALPLWRRDTMLGAPALGDPQALYGSPLHAAFRWLPPLRALGPTLVLHFWVGALGAFAFARVLGASAAAATLAAIAQLVCFKLIAAAYAGWMSVLSTLCMLPAIAAATVALARSPSWLNTLALGGSLAVALAGGTPQTLYYLLLCLAPYLPLAALTSSGSWAARRAQLARSAGAMIAAVALGLLANAYLWWPLLRDLPLLARGAQGYDYFLSGHGLGFSHLTTFLYPERLGTPLDRSYPDAELWEDVAYFGVLPWLASVGLLLSVHRANALVRYVCAAFVLSVWLSLDGPLLRAFYAIVPGYDVFRLPGRMLFVSAVLGIGLFAVALDALFARVTPRAAFWLGIAIALCVTLEGGYYARRYLRVVDESHLRVPAGHPARAIDPVQPSRVAVIGRSSFNYGWAQSLGLRLLNGYNPYSFAHYKKFMDLTEHGMAGGVPLSNWFDLHEVARRDLLREAGVTHVIAQKPLPWPELELVARRSEVASFVFYKGFLPRPSFLYRLRDPHPLARLATRIEEVGSLDAMAARMQASRLDGQAYVLAPASSGRSAELGGKAGQAHVEHARPGAISVRTVSAGPGLLVVAEAFHPGWHATVDGEPTDVLQTNLLLQGVPLPAGTHRVQLRFSPPGLAWALPLSAAVWIAWLVLFAFELRRAQLRRGRA